MRRNLCNRASKCAVDSLSQATPIRWFAGILILIALLLSSSSTGLAAQPAAVVEPRAQDGDKVLPVSGIRITYHTPALKEGELPSEDEILKSVVVLVATPSGLVSAEEPPGYRQLRTTNLEYLPLSQIGQPPYTRVYASALHEILNRISDYFTDRGYMGVQVRMKELRQGDVTVSAVTFEPDTGKTTDNRDGATELPVEVMLARVAKVRTVASGSRIKDPKPGEQATKANARVDNSLHSWIIEQSPVRGADYPPADHLLRKQKLDKYIFWLNQHPGRHVDVSISAAENTTNREDVWLDYLVSESKTWMLYAQVSNTGTKQTNEWRERIGFTDNQLTNHDDILTLDYTTAGFSDSDTVSASYDAPFTRESHTRYRIFGIYDQFTASDVGQSSQQFTGNQEQFGGELSFNIAQRRELFVYLVVGGRFERLFVDNQTPGIDDNGEANYWIPYVSLRADDVQERFALGADITLLGGFTGASQKNLNAMGRTNPDGDYTLLQGSANLSLFLEPLIKPAEFNSNTGTLAWEAAFLLKGQYAFDSRLIPQAEQTAGGFYTVRGYPESVSVGDSVIIASAELRYHIPRSFKSEAQINKEAREAKQKGLPAPTIRQPKMFGQPFRWQPQQPYGRPDWDLVPKAFIDLGQTYISDPLSFEHNDTLIGTGVGLELQIKQNLNLRVDWAVALKDIDDPSNSVSAGSHRFHISFTVLY